MASACAPCVLGAASSNLLSYPYSVVTATVTAHPVVLNMNGTNITSTSIQSYTEYATSSGASPGLTFSGGAPLLWTTLGTELTYPNTYAQYFAFTGAAVSTPPPAQCAETLAPTTVALASSTPLIFDTTGQTGLPQALLAYLDSIPSFTAQLGNNAVASCAAATAAPVTTLTSTNTRSFVLFNTTTSSTIVTTGDSTSTSVTSLTLTTTSVSTDTVTEPIITTPAPSTVIVPTTVTTVMTVTGTSTFLPSGSTIATSPSSIPSAVGDLSSAFSSAISSATSTSSTTTPSTTTSSTTTSSTTTSSTIISSTTISSTTTPLVTSSSTTTVVSTSTVVVSTIVSSSTALPTSSVTFPAVAPPPASGTTSISSTNSSVVSSFPVTSLITPSGPSTTIPVSTVLPYTGTGFRFPETPALWWSTLGFALLMAWVVM